MAGRGVWLLEKGLIVGFKRCRVVFGKVMLMGRCRSGVVLSGCGGCGGGGGRREEVRAARGEVSDAKSDAWGVYDPELLEVEVGDEGIVLPESRFGEGVAKALVDIVHISS